MKNTLQDELRQKMRELRNIGGYSQKDMANAMGIAQSSYFKIQNGQTEITIRHISDCAEFFCVSPIEFITFSAEELSGRIRRKSSFPLLGKMSAF